MDSSIWVAVTTRLPREMQVLMMDFWISGSSSNGTSTPRSPRATTVSYTHLFKEHFRSRFEVSDAQIFLSRTAPLKLGYAFSLGEHLPEKKRAFLSDAPFTPQQPAMLSAGQSLLKAALQRDILLSYPYELSLIHI